jgi:hypothetical protein
MCRESPGLAAMDIRLLRNRTGMWHLSPMIALANISLSIWWRSF